MIIIIIIIIIQTKKKTRMKIWLTYCAVKWAKLVLSPGALFDKELNYIKQTLINNVFPKHVIDEQI